MKISLIITTKNEIRTISKLLDSIAKQTRRPDEVVLADASTGRSLQVTGYSNKFPIKIITLPIDANRAVGRNTAIREARYEHILITDAGCRLKEDWVEKMSQRFSENQSDRDLVVAGFYEGEYQNIFEKCQIPYVLVMPDRLNPKDFLPATRSMGITRSAWEAVGGFNEAYRYAEDYDLARRLREAKIPIVTAPEAIVYWRPRQTLRSFARMIKEHAYGDAYAGNFRPKVATIYLRYLLFLGLSVLYLPAGLGLFGLYLLYAIKKNFRYVRHWKAIFYLPLLQVVSDLAVMWGTVGGGLRTHFIRRITTLEFQSSL